MHRLPELGIPQICMVGHSNVGKSSLINALVHGKEIARPSKSPGRTRHLFVFDLGQDFSLVDLPGFGYARVSEDLKYEWTLLIQEYLRRSKSLRRVVCLVDASTGLTKEDLQLWDTIQAAGRRMMVVLTKVDMCHAIDLHRNVAEVMAALQALDKELVWPYVHAVSAEHDLGMRELRASLVVDSLSGMRLEAAAAAARESAATGAGAREAPDEERPWGDEALGAAATGRRAEGSGRRSRVRARGD